MASEPVVVSEDQEALDAEHVAAPSAESPEAPLEAPTATSVEPEATVASTPSVPPQLDGAATALSDATSARDSLNRRDTARAVAELISDPEQGTPLTLAILGDWGAGKSTFIRFIREEMLSLETAAREVARTTETERPDRNIHVAQMSAWAYEQADNMGAALTQTVVETLGTFDERPGWNRLKLATEFHRRLQARKVRAYGAAVGALVLAGLLAIIGATAIDDATVATWILGASFATGAGTLPFLYGLFRWVKKALAHPFGENLKTYLELPKYSDSLGLAPIFKQHIDTLLDLRLRKDDLLVVVVEDLDRCQPSCIAKTLDAIRLVMDREKVVVIIAIDHRIALEAMAEKYEKVSGNRSAGQMARDYLGKIIQIPFQLQQPSDPDVDAFIQAKLFPNDEIAEGGTRGTTDPCPSGAAPAAGQDARSGREVAIANVEEPESETDSGADQLEPARGRALAMRHTKREQEWFVRLAWDFDFSNPRLLTRLRNSYRLLRRLAPSHRGNAGEKLPGPRGLMRLLFWHEFLAQRSADERAACLAVVGRSTVTPNESHPYRAILEAAGTWLGEYREAETLEPGSRFVRQVILPEAGV